MFGEGNKLLFSMQNGVIDFLADLLNEVFLLLLTYVDMQLFDLYVDKSRY